MILYNIVSIFPFTENIKDKNLTKMVKDDPHHILHEDLTYDEYDDAEYFSMLYGEDIYDPASVVDIFQDNYLGTFYKTYKAAGGMMIQVTINGYENERGERIESDAPAYYHDNDYICL